MPLSQYNLNIKSASSEDLRPIICRELLRVVTELDGKYDRGVSGWDYSRQYDLLILIHAVIVATKYGTDELNLSVNIANERFLRNHLHSSNNNTHYDYCIKLIEKLAPQNKTLGEDYVYILNESEYNQSRVQNTDNKIAKELDIIDLPLSLGLSVFETSLYHGQTADGANEILQNIRHEIWTKNYWADWYQGFLDGTPMDWELQKKITLIPDADWEKGAVHIAEIIEEIQARFITDKIPLNETMEINPQTGKFFITYQPARKPDLLATTLEKVSDNLDDALNGRNGLTDNSRETRVLRRCIEKYAHNPERIEMDFVDVHAGLMRQMNSGELPESEENLSLATTLKDGALDVRANHPDVAKNRESRAKHALRELTPEQRQQLTDAQPILTAITEGEAHDDFINDIPSLINDAIGAPENNAPPLGAAIRTINRAAKISILMRVNGFDEKFAEKHGYKLTTILNALLGIVSFCVAIYSI